MLSQTSVILISLSVLHCLIYTSASPLETTKEAETPVHARQAWIQMDKDLKSAVGKIVRRAMPYVMKEVYIKEVSAPCLGALMGFTKALRESKLWAYKSKFLTIFSNDQILST